MEHLRRSIRRSDGSTTGCTISLHQQVRRRVGAGVEADVDDYEERRVMHALMGPSTTDLDALLTELRRTPEALWSSTRSEIASHITRQGATSSRGTQGTCHLMLSKDR